MAKFETLWFWQKSRLTSEWFEVYSYTTDEHPHPYLSRSPNPPTSARCWSSTSIDSLGNLIVHLPSDHLPDAPRMWYLLHRDYKLPLLSQSLIAFDTDHHQDGTVIEMESFNKLGISPDLRVAAIKWGFGDPKLLQLYVRDDYRRRRVSTKLINVADITNVAGNWGGFIYGGDQVTALGAKLAEAWADTSRLMPTEIILPSMD